MSSKFRAFIFPFIYICFFGCSLLPNELKVAEEMMETAPDSALMVLKMVSPIQLINPADKALYALLLSQAYDKTDSLITSDSLISIATKYYNAKEPVRAGYAWLYTARCAKNRNNAEVQANALLKAQEFAEMTDCYKLQGLIYCDKADMYQSQKQMDSMIIHNKKGFHAFLKANDTYNAVLTAISVGQGYSSTMQPDSATKYFSTAEKYAQPLNDTLLTATIYKGFGNNAYFQKDYKKALYFFRKAPLTHNDVYDYNKWYLISYIFESMDQLDSAKYYLNKVKPLDFTAINYYSLWLRISEREKNYSKSIYFAKKLIATKDSAYDYKLKNSFAGLEKKYHYENLKVANNNLIIKNKQKGIIILVILLLISILVIILINWRYRNKANQLTIQQELNEKEKALLEKANENNTLLQQQSRMQHILLQNVEQYRSETIKGKAVSGSEKKQTPAIDKIEEEIIIYIDSAYKNLSKRLSAAYPHLTQRDILICCMLLANFDTGMIATLLNVRNESINIHRSRLRKKLMLDNSCNLMEFLRHF